MCTVVTCGVWTDPERYGRNGRVKLGLVWSGAVRIVDVPKVEELEHVEGKL